MTLSGLIFLVVGLILLWGILIDLNQRKK